MGTNRAADTAVLNVLAPGGILTVDQVAAQSELTAWSTRRALSRLVARGLIVRLPHRACWSLAPRGVSAVGGQR